MPTTLPVTKIQEMVKKILSEEFIPRLIDRAVQAHTQGGQYPGCKCTYCETKRWATAYVGTTNMRSVRKFYYLLFDNGDNYMERSYWESALIQEEDQIRDLINNLREIKRFEARQELKREVERIL